MFQVKISYIHFINGKLKKIPMKRVIPSVRLSFYLSAFPHLVSSYFPLVLQFWARPAVITSFVLPRRFNTSYRVENDKQQFVHCTARLLVGQKIRFYKLVSQYRQLLARTVYYFGNFQNKSI